MADRLFFFRILEYLASFDIEFEFNIPDFGLDKRPSPLMLICSKKWQIFWLTFYFYFCLLCRGLRLLWYFLGTRLPQISVDKKRMLRVTSYEWRMFYRLSRPTNNYVVSLKNAFLLDVMPWSQVQICHCFCGNRCFSLQVRKACQFCYRPAACRTWTLHQHLLISRLHQNPVMYAYSARLTAA